MFYIIFFVFCDHFSVLNIDIFNRHVVASSGIASQLIPGGRTTHSRFAIPLQCHEESTCNIPQASQLAELLIHTKLIIWDEAPMTNKYYFEALDITLKDIMQLHNQAGDDLIFGGKLLFSVVILDKSFLLF